MKASSIILLLIILFSNLFAQKFWLTTYEFPGGPKTGITLASDSCLFVGLQAGIIRSCDEGNDFDSVLNTSVIFTVFAAKSGKVYAGGSGKIFYTDNLGQTWDSVSLSTTYPVTQIIENQQGHLFAITGTLTINGYAGDGVFFSNDEGLNWSQRNNGLGIYNSMERIAIDKNGRLYVAAADEYVTGNGGLFISENNGLLWEHISISVDGQGVIDNDIKIANTWGLSISPDDSVYFSFEGTAVNVYVRLNVRKSINDIRSNNFWLPYNVYDSASWWDDRNLNDIHFAQNGDWYSSMNGSIISGATYFSKDKGINWQRIDYGLGLDINNKRNIQYFAETSSGKVFMVQLLDERVYWADTSVLTSLIQENPAGSSIFPNPAKAGQTVTLRSAETKMLSSVMITDLSGKTEMIIKSNFKNEITIQAPESPGIYFIHLLEGDYRRALKLVVL